MNQRLTAVSRLPAIVLSAATTFLLTSASSAATIVVPPVTINQLQHLAEPGLVRDGVTIPGPGCTMLDFQATISTGDHVTVRIQAPVGKRFVVHAPLGALGHFLFSVYWHTAQCQGNALEEAPHTVTFEDLQGSPPSQDYSYVHLGTDGETVAAQKSYTYTSAFEFTAISFDITASSQFPAVPGDYSLLGSNYNPGFCAADWNGDPLLPVMEIVDMVTPVRSTSWGRIKALYR